MSRKIPQFAIKEQGVTATEYALIIAVVALIMLIGAQLLGTNLNTIFSSVAGMV